MSTLSVWKKFSIGALSWQPPVRLIDGVAFIAASWHVEEPRDFEVSGYARRSKIVLSGEFMVSPPSATRNEPVMNAASSDDGERRSGVWGRRVQVWVDVGGGRLHKKK